MLSASAEPGVAPKLADDETDIVPADKVVFPEQVFVPDKVKVPEPDFIIEPVPDVSVILPAYVVFDD